ncbi:thioredoxin family protein [Microbacterium sp.]|uniref:thioredoxin family protein n=1 Tax=Microbacterium sp. TaxID=51671 RepID=UPI003A869C9B
MPPIPLPHPAERPHPAGIARSRRRHGLAGVSVAAVAVAATLTLAGCSAAADDMSGQTPMADSTAMADETPMSDEVADGDEMAVSMAPGAYLTLAEYRDQMDARADTTVVYFFHADWCPSCRSTDQSLQTDGVPDGLTVVKVDFDTETDLKKQYGITQQHTFVQVAPDGAALATWSGSGSGAEIKAETVHP